MPGLFPERSPRRLLTDAASGGLDSPPARRARRAKTSITGTARIVLAIFYIVTTFLSWTHDLRKRVGSVVPGEARHAQRVLVVVVGIKRLTCDNALGGVGCGRSRLAVLPHFCHISGRDVDVAACRS